MYFHFFHFITLNFWLGPMNNRENNLKPKCFNVNVLWWLSVLTLVAHEAERSTLHRALTKTIKIIPLLKFRESNNIFPYCSHYCIHIRIQTEVGSVIVSVLLTVWNTDFYHQRAEIKKKKKRKVADEEIIRNTGRGRDTEALEIMRL